MRSLRIAGLVLLTYVAVVVAFESLIGVLQPANASTLVLTSWDADGITHDRVLARLDFEGRLYVAANHWPRAWFRRVQANPEVVVIQDGEKAAHLAVLVSGAEEERIARELAHGLMFRILTGFPPRYFVRLDPV